PLGIRWPNDIEAGGRKLGGILPERIASPWGSRLALGIGLNVTTRLVEAPFEVRGMAVALSELVAMAPEPANLLTAILAQPESVPPRLGQDDPALAACWEGLDTLRDQWVRVDLGPRIVRGLGRGIDAQGALRLEVDGQVVPIVGGQVLRDTPARSRA